MKRHFEISVIGCDDATYIEYELTEKELKLVEDIAKKVTDASEYGCMPVMEIKLKDEKENEND